MERRSFDAACHNRGVPVAVLLRMRPIDLEPTGSDLQILITLNRPNVQFPSGEPSPQVRVARDLDYGAKIVVWRVADKNLRAQRTGPDLHPASLPLLFRRGVARHRKIRGMRWSSGCTARFP